MSLPSWWRPVSVVGVGALGVGLYIWFYIAKFPPLLLLLPATLVVTAVGWALFTYISPVRQGVIVTLLGIWVTSAAIPFATGHDRKIDDNPAESPTRRSSPPAKPHTARALATFTKHSDEIESVSFSPDSRRLATGGRDHTIRVWDAISYAPVGRPLKGHSGRVNTVAFSPDGALLATGGGDAVIRLWDVEDGRQVGQLARHRDSVQSVAFSPDGKTLASSSDDQTVILWNIGTKDPLGRPLVGHTDYVVSAKFSPDGTLLATGSGDGTARLWDVGTRRQIRPSLRHADVVESVAFSPDGKILATGSRDRTTRLWDLSPRAQVARLTSHQEVRAIAFSPDGASLTTCGGDDGTTQLWSMKAYRPIGPPIIRHSQKIDSLAISPNGKLLATGSDDKTARLWRL